MINYKTFNFSEDERDFMYYVLNDKRSWGVPFQEVEINPDILVYKTPAKILEKMYPYNDLKGLSLCDRSKKPIVIHLRKENWEFPKGGYENVYEYRIYLILHEFGHALGHNHEKCTKVNEPAPVMMQQTKGTYPCYPDPWVKKDKYK